MKRTIDIYKNRKEGKRNVKLINNGYLETVSNDYPEVLKQIGVKFFVHRLFLFQY